MEIGCGLIRIPSSPAQFSRGKSGGRQLPPSSPSGPGILEGTAGPLPKGCIFLPLAIHSRTGNLASLQSQIQYFQRDSCVDLKRNSAQVSIFPALCTHPLQPMTRHVTSRHPRCRLVPGAGLERRVLCVAACGGRWCTSRDRSTTPTVPAVHALRRAGIPFPPRRSPPEPPRAPHERCGYQNHKAEPCRLTLFRNPFPLLIFRVPRNC